MSATAPALAPEPVSAAVSTSSPLTALTTVIAPPLALASAESNASEAADRELRLSLPPASALLPPPLLVPSDLLAAAGGGAEQPPLSPEATDVLQAVLQLATPLSPLAHAGPSVAGVGAAGTGSGAGGGAHHPASSNVFQVLTGRLKDLELDRGVISVYLADLTGKLQSALTALVHQAETATRGVNSVRNATFGIRHATTVDALVDALAAAREGAEVMQRALVELGAREEADAAHTRRVIAELDLRVQSAVRAASLCALASAACAGAALSALLCRCSRRSGASL